jgi:N-acetyl-gamma-glutamyl-phosphate reductase
VIIHAASGVTGAGRAAKRELLFGEVAEDYRAYAVGNTHRHLLEMNDQVRRIADQAPPALVFAPHLLPVRRGILETIHLPLRPGVDAAGAAAAWADDYAGEPFVAVHDDAPPSLADVVGSNRVALHVTPVAGVDAPLLQLTAAIDNLLKGAAGQAVQNMNLMFGLPESEALL